MYSSIVREGCSQKQSTGRAFGSFFSNTQTAVVADRYIRLNNSSISFRSHTTAVKRGLHPLLGGTKQAQVLVGAKPCTALCLGRGIGGNISFPRTTISGIYQPSSKSSNDLPLEGQKTQGELRRLRKSHECLQRQQALTAVMLYSSSPDGSTLRACAKFDVCSINIRRGFRENSLGSCHVLSNRRGTIIFF